MAGRMAGCGMSLAKHLKASVREVWPLSLTLHCLRLDKHFEYTPFLWSQATDRAVQRADPN
jgi:hypothetical protein